MQRPFNSEPLLRLEAVRLTLMSQAGPVNILNGIDLKVAKGEAIGLVGPSGSGKSTMLMVMSGLERPTTGKVMVAGQELSKFDEDAAARFRRGNVGIVFQSFHLIPTMTALENVAVPLELALVPNAFDRAREELEAVGLAHRLDHYPTQLSGGEQQRVALARAIAPRPGLLFADEPTGNLDGRTGNEIMSLMFALQKERGTTLVLVTHDEDLVRRCDRIVRLRDGRIDGIETIEHTAPPIMMPAPLGRFEPVVKVEKPIATEPPSAKKIEVAVAPPPTPPSHAPAEIAPAEAIAAEPAVPAIPEIEQLDPVELSRPDVGIEMQFEHVAAESLTIGEMPVVEPAKREETPLPPEMELAIGTPEVTEVVPIAPGPIDTPAPADDVAPGVDTEAPPQLSSDAPTSEPEFRRVAAGGE